MITHLGAYPSLAIGPLLDTHRTDTCGFQRCRPGIPNLRRPPVLI
jgi:hypothetical protein